VVYVAPFGLPVATEQKVALSRPVYWTAKLHTDVAADLGLFVWSVRASCPRIWVSCPARAKFYAKAVIPRA
jgi:hypothetical protein